MFPGMLVFRGGRWQSLIVFFRRRQHVCQGASFPQEWFATDRRKFCKAFLLKLGNG